MNKKAKVRFNIVDFLIIVAVLAAILTVVFRGTLTELIGTVVYTNDAVIAIRIDGLGEEQLDLIKDGDVLNIDGEKFGSIISKSSENSTVIKLSESGAGNEFQRVRDPERYDVTCAINAKGTYNNDGFYLSGKRFMGVGEKITVVSDKYSFEATVISFS